MNIILKNVICTNKYLIVIKKNMFYIDVSPGDHFSDKVQLPFWFYKIDYVVFYFVRKKFFFTLDSSFCSEEGERRLKPEKSSGEFSSLRILSVQ
jgi:hypothetical protein